jgi:SepF-like predicted cell division protein (DUF552 family)
MTSTTTTSTTPTSTTTTTTTPTTTTTIYETTTTTLNEPTTTILNKPTTTIFKETKNIALGLDNGNILIMKCTNIDKKDKKIPTTCVTQKYNIKEIKQISSSK